MHVKYSLFAFSPLLWTLSITTTACMWLEIMPSEQFIQFMMVGASIASNWQLHSHSLSGYLSTLETRLALQLTFSFWTPNWRQDKWQQTQCPFLRVHCRWWRAPLPQSHAHESEECPLEGRQSQEYIINVWNCKKIATVHVHLYRYISAPPLFHNCICYVFSLPVNTRDGLVRLMLPCSSSSPICCCLRPAYVYRLTAVVSKPACCGAYRTNVIIPSISLSNWYWKYLSSGALSPLGRSLKKPCIIDREVLCG